MLESRKWRFPNNNYTDEKGLDTSDMETFRKDPVSSLAREICQNSIDAASGTRPVKVEFELFEIAREDIPGVDELEAQILDCYNYKKDSPKEKKALAALKRNIGKSKIKCLRISDFNTTGIEGAASNSRGTPFYNLTKGSGVSDKFGTKGGSKGIGKFASFVVSGTNTVFYSTLAKDNSAGFIGISKLRSVPIKGEDPDLLTMGIGYYGINEKNYPVLEELHLAPDFERNKEEYGTDVYIIGFNDEKGWQSDIIAKILESFMVAIMKGDLEVIVDKHLVSNNTVREIIYDDKFQEERSKKEVRDVRAQYELLEGGEGVFSEELLVKEDNKVVVYVKKYSQQEETNATRQCIMVRYPYMKITYIKTGTYLPFSALCIIPDNMLNQKLRSIENPQHTDWEIKRLNDDLNEKRITRTLKKAMEETVKNYINEVLKQNAIESSDIEGAGEFLPSQDDLGESEANMMPSEQVMVMPISLIKPRNPKTVKSGEEGEGYDFSTGDDVGTGDEGRTPKKKKKKSNPNPNPKSEPTDNPNTGEGSMPILHKIPLSGMKYRNVVTNKENGQYDCIFVSLFDESNCEFGIRMCGVETDKYPINILSATIDGQDCDIQDGKIIGLQITKGKLYKISYVVARNKMFSSEVIMNAYR